MSFQVVSPPPENPAAITETSLAVNTAATTLTVAAEKVASVYTILDRLIYVLVFTISLAGLVIYHATDGAGTACLFGAVMSIVSLSNHTNLQTVTSTLGGLIGLNGTKLP